MTNVALAPRVILLGLVVSRFLAGQTGPGFEVASIRGGAPFSMELMRAGGVGMTVEGRRVAIRSLSLSELIAAAYEVRTDQISGPGWLTNERFDIQALMPEGLTKADVPALLRDLLTARFRMRATATEKEFPVFVMEVKGSGHLLKASAGTGGGGVSGCALDGKGRRTCQRMTMDKLAGQLTQLYRMYVAMPPGGMAWGLELPTVDATGLAGEFDFEMQYGPGAEDAGGGTLVDAVDRLGLKLTKQKRVERLIRIDSMEKVPTEN